GYQVMADQRLLRQVVGNLVSNAIKFSPPGTQTCLWADVVNDRVRIYVADGGPGIPPEERGKLFTMFSKLSTRPTGGETSTGLGLWIVKELIQLQGGRVGIDQPADGGSAFWVELPAA
ncbi:MAG: ATP-binding protein, partial [Chloroflexota bacterium]